MEVAIDQCVGQLALPKPELEPVLLDVTALAEVAHHSRKALQVSAIASKGHRKHIRPESRPVLLHSPAFVSEMTLISGPRAR